MSWGRMTMCTRAGRSAKRKRRKTGGEQRMLLGVGNSCISELISTRVCSITELSEFVRPHCRCTWTPEINSACRSSRHCHVGAGWTMQFALLLSLLVRCSGWTLFDRNWPRLAGPPVHIYYWARTVAPQIVKWLVSFRKQKHTWKCFRWSEGKKYMSHAKKSYKMKSWKGYKPNILCW